MNRLLPCLIALLPALASAQPPTYTNPVIPGDHPDPSVIRVGGEYWATATTSQWAPIFPLLRSTDLVNWTLEGSVFEHPPEWSEGSYWAPEIDHHEGRFSVYYTARRKGGPLCVAVATAAKVSGPYTDHGPMVCQEVGSIDAVAVTSEDGERFLVWKEDGNSRKLPTPLWAQRLSADGTRLEGDRHELLRNEATWEGHLIEGPFIVRRDGWFYMFYSAGACCGRRCDYRLGVARARKLLGPWERSPENPILSGNQHWKCPGHGSIVTDAAGRDFLLYHAYHPEDFEYTGRQGLLDEITWDAATGWPSINAGRGPSDAAASPLGAPQRSGGAVLVDEFTTAALQEGWQWPWDRTPDRRLVDGALVLRSAGRNPSSAVDTVVGRPALEGSYVATTRVLTKRLAPGTTAGLSVFGNAANAIGLSLADGRAIVWRRQKDVQQTIATANVPMAEAVHLRITARDGATFTFAMSTDGTEWRTIGDQTTDAHLPPWDLAVRIALAVGGPAGAEAAFDWLRVEQAQ